MFDTGPRATYNLSRSQRSAATREISRPLPKTYYVFGLKAAPTYNRAGPLTRQSKIPDPAVVQRFVARKTKT